MQAHGDYLLFLAHARVDELRREAARHALARSLEPQRQRQRWRLRKRRAVARPVVPLPRRAEGSAAGDLRRSA